MTLNTYDSSVGLFIRGLTNLKRQLTKAEDHAATAGLSATELLEARLAADGRGPDVASYSPRDTHAYTLASHVHWAAEGAKLAVGHLLGAPAPPATSAARSFAALHQHIDGTIAQLRDASPGDLDSGLDRSITIEHPRGSVRARGRQFLVAFAIPHFFYHLSAAHGICRNQGVQLTMGDFLGDWGAG